MSPPLRGFLAFTPKEVRIEFEGATSPLTLLSNAPAYDLLTLLINHFFGLHLFLETNSDDPAVCTPRWFPDAARLFNGNGTAPFSAGLAPREEFFAAVRRGDVRRALQKELKALCQQRAPEARWQWTPPPTDASELTPVRLPAYEERDLLIDPKEEKQREKNLLGDDQKPSQTTGSASRQ